MSDLCERLAAISCACESIAREIRVEPGQIVPTHLLYLKELAGHVAYLSLILNHHLTSNER